MAEGSMMGASVEASSEASSYRVKFDRDNFKEIVHIAKPRIIYRRKNMYFFAYDGFIMYCDQCDSSDFSQRIIDTIEFSNYQWSK